MSTEGVLCQFEEGRGYLGQSTSNFMAVFNTLMPLLLMRSVLIPPKPIHWLLTKAGTEGDTCVSLLNR